MHIDFNSRKFSTYLAQKGKEGIEPTPFLPQGLTFLWSLELPKPHHEEVTNRGSLWRLNSLYSVSPPRDYPTLEFFVVSVGIIFEAITHVCELIAL